MIPSFEKQASKQLHSLSNTTQFNQMYLILKRHLIFEMIPQENKKVKKNSPQEQADDATFPTKT